MTDQNHLPESVEKTPARFRWWRIALLAIVAALLVIGFLPSFVVSQKIVNPLLASLLEENLRATVDEVSLGWFRPLRISGLQVHANPGGQIFHVEQIQTERSLIPILLDLKHIGAVNINEPTVNLTLMEQGTNFRALVDALTPAAKSPEEKDDDPKRQPLRSELQVRVHKLKLEVRDGEQTKPLLATPPSDFMLAYSALAGPPTVSLSSNQLLDHAELTPELFQYGLQYVMPIVADATAVDGTISLNASGQLPLDHLLEFNVEGDIKVHSVGLVVKAPLINRIAKIVSTLLAKPMPERVLLVDDSVIKFRVQDQQVWHSGVRFGLPQIDPKLVLSTHGTVHFDRSLDLILEVPVPMRLLGTVIDPQQADQARLQTLAIPIRGTLDDPIIEWKAASEGLTGLLDQAAESLQAAGMSDSIRAGVVKRATAILEGEGDASEVAETAIGVAAELWKRRQERKATESAASDKEADQSTETASDDDSSAEPKRPGLLERIRNRRRESPEIVD